MKIQPRQQLLEIWEATARASLQRPTYGRRGGEWLWGGRNRTSISDAQQLMCLLGPATKLIPFRLDVPDETSEDVEFALRPFGDSVEIPQLLVQVLTDYCQTYVDADDTPIFSGGSAFVMIDPAEEVTEKQRELDVVASIAVSVRLSLAAIGFAKVFRRSVRREDLRARVRLLEDLASRRLTAAMVALLRSFVVNLFDADSEMGDRLCTMVNQSRLPRRRVVEDLHDVLGDVRARLRDLTAASGLADWYDLENPNKLFECGWSWGVARKAPQVETEALIAQHEGVAAPVPSLYFTALALAAIEELFSERTRLLGLLDDDQQRLARALQSRWEITRDYWAKLATFGSLRWPVEDIPWQLPDGTESEYFTLLICGITIDEMTVRRGVDVDLGRMTSVLGELSMRARITRRPVADDPSVAVHWPGLTLPLPGSEEVGTGRLGWIADDFATLLLRGALRSSTLAGDGELRGKILTLSDAIWAHLVARRLPGGAGRGLWDRPSGVFRDLPDDPDAPPHWDATMRAVECLVVAAELVNSPPLRSARLVEAAGDLISEAEHLFDRQLFHSYPGAGPAMRTAMERIRLQLQRAREIERDRPGSAAALAQSVLLALDELAAARRDATEVD